MSFTCLPTLVPAYLCALCSLHTTGVLLLRLILLKDENGRENAACYMLTWRLWVPTTATFAVSFITIASDVCLHVNETGSSLIPRVSFSSCHWKTERYAHDDHLTFNRVVYLLICLKKSGFSSLCTLMSFGGGASEGGLTYQTEL